MRHVLKSGFMFDSDGRQYRSEIKSLARYLFTESLLAVDVDLMLLTLSCFFGMLALCHIFCDLSF